MINEDTKITTKVLGYMMTGYQHGKNSTKYNVEVNQGMNTWSVKRSFGEFLDLHKKLKKVCKTLPKAPKRKLFKVVKHEALEERKEKLDAYLSDLVNVQEIQSNLHYVQFLDLQSKYSATSVNDLNLVGYLTLKGQGYKDIKISQEDNLLFGVCAGNKENFISKNIALKSKEAGGIQGSVEVWKRDGDVKIDSYKYLWTYKPQKHRVRCIDYNSELSLLVVGCEGGFVVGLKLNHDDNSFIEDFNIHVHNRKESGSKILKRCGVVGLYIDAERNKLFSVGEDKNLKIMDLERRELVNCKPDFLKIYSYCNFEFKTKYDESLS